VTAFSLSIRPWDATGFTPIESEQGACA
jgi:hypothetical protein